MIAEVSRFTNEGMVVTCDSKTYNILRGGFSRDIKIGDKIEITVVDKKNNIAILSENKVEDGRVLTLRVKEKARVGFFLDTFGADDLFMPFAETTGKVKPGDRVVVKVMRDRKDRLFGSMRISDHVSNSHNYVENDEVVATIYSVRQGLGVFGVIDEDIDARLDANEMTRGYEVGDKEKFRVKYVLPDGKISLTKRERSHLQIDKDSVIIMDGLMKTGRLSIGDKSSPEEILEVTGLSKQAFKRACGRLLKQGLIEVGPVEVRRVED